MHAVRSLERAHSIMRHKQKKCHFRCHDDTTLPFRDWVKVYLAKL